MKEQNWIGLSFSPQRHQITTEEEEREMLRLLDTRDGKEGEDDVSTVLSKDREISFKSFL